MPKLCYRSLAGLIFGLALAGPVAADNNKNDKYLIRSTDNMRTILEQEIDLPVRIVLRSGQELRGTVERLGTGIVQLSHLVGSDYYDAVINLDDISAVVFRVRQP